MCIGIYCAIYGKENREPWMTIDNYVSQLEIDIINEQLLINMDMVKSLLKML